MGARSMHPYFRAGKRHVLYESSTSSSDSSETGATNHGAASNAKSANLVEDADRKEEAMEKEVAYADSAVSNRAQQQHQFMIKLGSSAVSESEAEEGRSTKKLLDDQ